MSEKSKIVAIIQGKCPQCREGSLFQFGAYQLGRFTKVHKNCPKCGVAFEKEPRFFDGSMYISYALSVGLFLISALIIYTFFHPVSEDIYMIAIISEVIVLYPLMFRYSRIFYLYIFGDLKYNANAVKD